MHSFPLARLARGASLVLVASILASVATAQAPVAWDQKAVTNIAVKLAQAVKDLNLTVKKNPDQPIGSPGRRAQYNARESLKLLTTVSARLASQLKAGEDKDATLPTYKRLQSIRRDAEEEGRKANIPGPTLEKVVGTKALVEQLAPYYEDAPSAAAPTTP